MTPAERKRHAAAILKLRMKRLTARCGRGRGWRGSEADDRHTVTGAAGTRGEIAAVDEMFRAQQRSGRFPKGCWR